MATPIPPNQALFTAWSAAAACQGRVVRALGEESVAVGITTDSRALTPGGAFVALRGQRSDGHTYLAEAQARGAALLVVEEGAAVPPGPAAVVAVRDTLEAWGALARAHLREWRRERGDGRVVAITGSAGKTTTKELTALLLAAAGPTLATAGNLNNRIGLPAMAFTATVHHRFLVLEAGMSLRGEIAALAAIAEPDVGVIVNVSLAHAEGVGGTRADVAREKGSLYEALDRAGVAIVNADDAAARGQLARSAARAALRFGRGEDAHYRLAEREVLPGGGSRLLVLRRAPRSEFPERLSLELPYPGEAAALDLLAALAAADAAAGEALPLDTVRSALATLPALAGRAHVRRAASGLLVVDDSYNANPASMAAALASLREIAGPSRRLVAVLGEMKELGEVAEREHEHLGRAAADAGVALLITCGGLSHLTAREARAHGVTVEACETASAAAAWAAAHLEAGDAVLVKASRSVGAELVVSALLARHGDAKGECPP